MITEIAALRHLRIGMAIGTAMIAETLQNAKMIETSMMTESLQNAKILGTSMMMEIAA